MAIFSAKGFEKLTIFQVADAAWVSKMTVTNYFPRKEDLVFDRAEAIIRSLADAAAAREPGESLLTAIRHTTPSLSPLATLPSAPRDVASMARLAVLASRGRESPT